jgi:uncharacterized protein (DUF2062 family)
LLRGAARVLQLDDTPESIGRGVGLGLFIAFTPTVGIQMFIILIVNTIFRANRLAGLAMVWISNPVTVVPIYWWNYVIGVWLMGRESIAFERFERLFTLESEGFLAQFMEFVNNLGGLGMDVALPLTLGGFATGTLLGLIAYPAAATLVRKEHAAIERLQQLRERRRERKKERLKERARHELGLDQPHHALGSAGSPSEAADAPAVATGNPPESPSEAPDPT